MTETRARLQIETSGDQLVLTGAIDETARLADVIARAPAGPVILDLAGVTFINSVGVRDWIMMMAAIRKADRTIELRRVSEPIIHQLNMISATRANARVSSFYAPYSCDGCGREDTLLIDSAAHAAELAKSLPPPMACPECSGNMAFNDYPDRYFAFLRS